MEDCQTFTKALDTAYRLLTARPHTRTELRRKLGRKKYPDETIAAVIEELAARGYINEEEAALRWAQALVRDKHWGPLKIAAYLAQKGIDRQTVEAVQRELWSEVDQAGVARRALGKRFGSQEMAPQKKAAFLRARGFSADVIYAVTKQTLFDEA